MNMLQQDKVDIVRDMAITNLAAITADSNLKYEVPYTSFRIISMNTQTKPFNDPRVVEALKYCIDPEILAQACQGKLGEDVFFSESFVAKSLKEYFEVAPREQNIEKAKELLAAAGYADGLEIDVYYESDMDFSGPIALAMQNMAAPAGITINLKGNTRDVFLSQYWNQVDFSITAWTPKIDPAMLFQLAAYTDAPWNEMKLANADADSILDRILAETDEGARLELYKEYQTWFRDFGAMLNVQVPFIVAENARVQNYHEPLTRIIDIEDIDLAMGE
jgi:peptide/nickel transport system substrate-binding protein